jgi:hypothetical protein
VTILIKWKCIQNHDTSHVKGPEWISVGAEDDKDREREIWIGFIWLRLGKSRWLLRSHE